MSDTPSTAGGLSNRRWLALALIAAAQFMVIMDTSIIGVALPEMQTDLGFSPQDLSWVFNAYVVAFGGLLLLGGRLSDLLGARRIFLTGWAILAVGSLVAGLAGNVCGRARRPGRPGRRRGADRPRGADPAVHDLRRLAQGAHQGHRAVRRGSPRRRHRRRVPRRRAHRVRQLAVGLLHQHPAGGRRPGSHAVGHAGRRHPARPPRPDRGRHRHRGARGGRLRRGPRTRGRMDVGGHPGRRAGWSGPAGALRGPAGPDRGPAGAARHLPGPEPRRQPTSPSSCWVRRGSRCSSSSTSTCSRCSASAPSPAVRRCCR